jgi:hypothetical protein
MYQIADSNNPEAMKFVHSFAAAAAAATETSALA